MPHRRIRSARLVIALLAVLGVGYLTAVPGPFSMDEVTYVLSARSMTLGYGIEVWNGYEEFPSPALAPVWLKPVDGRLVSQYPDFYLLFAYPAFLLLGLRGLMLVNVLAYVLVCGLIWSLAAHRFGTWVAGVALALFTFASFAWEYAVGAWPHMVSALFVLAPLVLVDRLLDVPAAGRRVRMALAAGLVAGVGVGIRLDVAFALAALAGGLMLQRKALWREAVALLAGALPPLVALALLNYAKFGLATPFTYGPSFGIAVGVAPYLPLAAAVGVAGLMIWLATRPAISARLRPAPVGVLVTIGLIVVLTVPASRATIVQAARGFGEMLVETRIRPIETYEVAWPRGADGSIIYFGSLKKALLQSCPWLPLIVLPLVGARGNRQLLDRLILWMTVPVAFAVPYSVFAWDAGLCLNQRYLVPALPVLAILGALGIDGLRARRSVPLGWLCAGVLAAVATGLVASEVTGFSLRAQSALLLSAPVAVASLLAIALATVPRLQRSPLAPASSAAVALVLGLALGLAACSCLLYDLRRTLDLRGRYVAFGAAVQPYVGNDALLLSDPPELLTAAIGPRSRLRLAITAGLSDAEITDLVRFFAGRGMPVVIGIDPERTQRLIDQGWLSGLALALLPSPRGMLVRVTADERPPQPAP